MYQYSDRLNTTVYQVYVYIYIWLWLQCFDPYLGHRQCVKFSTWMYNVLHFLTSLYRPDDDPDKGRNIVAKAKYIYTW
jgi:hypothetical protein